MKLYNNLKEFGTYLSSIRLADDFVFIDLILPKSWLIPQSYLTDKFVVTFGIKNEINKTGITFVFQNNELSFDEGLAKIFKVIKDNLEIEQKSILLNKNIDILKELFNKNKLDDLNNLEFLMPKNNPKNIEDGENKVLEISRGRKK